jgi:hypothetical protein
MDIACRPLNVQILDGEFADYVTDNLACKEAGIGERGTARYEDFLNPGRNSTES